jgi:ribosome biogenesis GTPase
MKRQETIQEKRLARAKNASSTSVDDSPQSLGPEQTGLLVAHYGTTLIVENQAGNLFRCGLRQNLGTLVTGDEIIWQQIDETNGIVVAMLPRRSVISKPDRRATKPIVANVDLMVVVCALEPIPRETTLCRYFVLAQTLGLNAILVVNKHDIPNRHEQDPLRARMKIFEKIGYHTIEVSSKTQHGIPELETALRNHTSILVGQSGVGKSSLLASLVPNAEVQIRELSALTRLGRHTTTATRLYHLPHGGNLIDSPGVQQFNLSHFTKNQIENGFREFVPLLGLCKFRNCEHLQEPGCALRTAVDNGDVAAFRLQNYHTILSDLDV